MKTPLLIHVLCHYLGPAKYVKDNGVAYWPDGCPLCGSDSFHTLPDIPTFKHYAKCWSCGFLEDVKGVLKEFHPEEPYSVVLDRLAAFKNDLKAREAPSKSKSKAKARPRPGARRKKTIPQSKRKDRNA